MSTNAPEVSPERQQTDESLAAEREKADTALAEHLRAFDELADAVISRARDRADAVLAASRAKTDSSSRGPAGEATVERRALEDKVVKAERENADEVVREERIEQVALLAGERDETDRDLDRERDQADDTVATRDEFLGVVSHDLRNLLNGVMGFAGLITMEVSRAKYGPEMVKTAEMIQRTGARMNRLIGDLVDVASIHAGTLAVSRCVEDPTHIVHEALDTFGPVATARAVTLRAELAAPPLSASFDPPRILQVLTNLLSNAIKFTPKKGEIVIRVERVEEGLRFSVSDTGIGLAPDKLEAIFQRYLQVGTNDRRGVGLGLYISRCIVQGHGGRIWVESKLGAGSTFRFTIPALPV